MRLGIVVVSFQNRFAVGIGPRAAKALEAQTATMDVNHLIMLAIVTAVDFV